MEACLRTFTRFLAMPPQTLTSANADTGVPAAVLNFDHLPDSARIDQKAVETLLSCSATSIWRWVKNGTLPRPMKYGRAVRWRVGDVRALLDGQGVSA